MEDRVAEPPELQDHTAVPAAEVPSGHVTDDDGEFEFEFPFPFVSRDSPVGTAALADDLFADGRIRPFYPVFGRAGGADQQRAKYDAPPAPRVRGPLGLLFLEESRHLSGRSTTSSSSAATSDEGGLEGAPPDSYCLWTPGAGPSASASAASPRPPRKSSSTGSMARWRRISELVVGRSHSDGKEKFLFLPTPPPSKEDETADRFKPKPKPRPTPPAGGRKQSAAAIHRIAYGAKATGGGGGGGTPRRTFLPYREELVGLFANVNGISRSHQHPF
ncbi:hypothetical protein GUJ93_ZPchr0010g7857 [Zizania palustris]|nr:hypothetical protein GUJ93_ZPchr0010g7857 [Zizania palustris]